MEKIASILESTHKEFNQHLKYVTPVQHQRPELPTVTLSWHVCKYKVHKLHQRYILSCIYPNLHSVLIIILSLSLLAQSTRNYS